MPALETHRMKDIAKDFNTKSDKIRALSDAGFERADIARFLDIRYQHVRNVLVGTRPARGASNSAGGTSNRTERRPGAGPVSARTVLKARVQLGSGGRVVVPAEMRSAMGVSEGDILLAWVADGELRLLSQETAVRKAQEIVRRHVPEGVSLVDELISERRDEARRESEQ